MNVLLEYIIVFCVVFVLNYFMLATSKKKYNKKHIPTELLYLKKIYGVDIKKISYEKFVITYAIINTFIISTIYIILMYLLNNWILRIIIGIVLLILMIIICYGFLAKYYLWKGRDK